MKSDRSCVLVCVTDQIGCRRLIQKGRELADVLDNRLCVVSVLPTSSPSKHTADTLQTLYNIACSLGADMQILFNKDPALTVAVYARQVGAAHLVSGAPASGSNDFIGTIHALLPSLPITVLDSDDRSVTLSADESEIA